MKLKSKIYIDKLIGIPIVFSLNLIFRFFILFKQEKELDNSTVKRIIVCKFMGMGSIIQSTSLLMSLRNNFPNAQIVFVTSPKNRTLLQSFPFVDKILIVNDKTILGLFTSSIKTAFDLWINKTDIFIDLEIYSYFSTLFTIFCFPKYKIGFYRKESRIQLGIYSKMIYFNTKAPVNNIYLQAAILLQCNSIVTKLYNYQHLFESNSVSLNNKLEKLNDPSKEYIVINPNASDLRIERRWDSANFTELIKRIIENYPDKLIVLIGSSEEVEYVGNIFQAIDKKYHSKIINTAGILSLTELIALIHNSCLVITNDTGPMHIAFSLNKKTIALFGPCSPSDYNNQQNVFFIYKNIYCSPCVHNFSISPCKGDNQCMKLIETDEVMNAVKNIFENKLLSTNVNSDIQFTFAEKNFPFGIVKRRR